MNLHQQQKDVYQHLVEDDLSGLITKFASVGKDALIAYGFTHRYERQTRRRGVSLSSEEKVDEFFRLSTIKSSSNKDTVNKRFVSETINSLQNLIFSSSGIDQKTNLLGDNAQNAITTKRTSSTASSRSNIEFENFLRKASSDLANHPPNASFIVQNRHNIEKRRKPEKMVIEETSDNTPPLFDGSIALATPRSIPTAGSGHGTALHLACALDSPFGLAVLLLLGGDAKSRHTGFQRSLVHEAASADSPDCLRLLLELGTQYEKSRQGSTVHCSGVFDWRNPRQEIDQTPKISFSDTLELMLGMAQQIEKGQLDDMEAARNLLSSLHLSEANKIAIASLCSTLPEPDNTRSVFPSPLKHTSVDGHGNTPLHWASFKNSTSCVSILLEYNANSSTKAEPSGWTPLHDAAYSNAAESVELLVKAGADVNVIANSGATPLCFAAQENAPEAAKLLLEAGANPQVRCCGQSPYRNVMTPHSRFSGYTPLHYCAHYNAHSAARILLEFANRHNQTESLLEIQDLNEKLPIHIAVARGSSDVLRELLHFGARVDITNNVVDAVSNQTTGENNSSAVSPPTRDLNENNEESSSPNVVTPVSSPVLRSLIPNQPILSAKPWNCLSQRSIDECRLLINEVESNWSPQRHTLFHPADRRAVLELLRVGKRLEQIGTGIFIDLWPEVLGFCGRGWFISDDSNKDQSNPIHTGLAQTGASKYIHDTEMVSVEDDAEFTQFQLDD